MQAAAVVNRAPAALCRAGILPATAQSRRPRMGALHFIDHHPHQYVTALPTPALIPVASGFTIVKRRNPSEPVALILKVTLSYP